MREWNVVNDAVEGIAYFCSYPYNQVKRVEESLLASVK